MERIRPENNIIVVSVISILSFLCEGGSDEKMFLSLSVIGARQRRLAQSHTHTCTHTRLCAHRHTYTHSHTHTYIHTYIHNHVYTYVYAYIHDANAHKQESFVESNLEPSKKFE